MFARSGVSFGHLTSSQDVSGAANVISEFLVVFLILNRYSQCFLAPDQKRLAVVLLQASHHLLRLTGVTKVLSPSGSRGGRKACALKADLCKSVAQLRRLLPYRFRRVIVTFVYDPFVVTKCVNLSGPSLRELLAESNQHTSKGILERPGAAGKRKAFPVGHLIAPFLAAAPGGDQSWDHQFERPIAGA